jgi:hypothetical protein
VLVWALPLCVAPASADTLRLANGGVVEGEIIEKTAETYTVRTLIGTVKLSVDSVASVEEGPSVFEDYRERVAATPDTPAAQTGLGEWCGEVGLTPERRRHLERAIELDPGYEPARKALGHVRVGAVWVDGRKRVDKPASQPALDPTDEQIKLTTAIQNHWKRRLRAIQANLLESSVSRLVADGQKRIAEIDDPLAISPLSEVLSDGGLNSREALVEALSRFEEDEATLNLGVLALVDPDANIRRQALTQLVLRNDERIGEKFRRALRTGNDTLIRRAAEGLVIVKYEAAVPELIEVLQAQRRKRVEVIVPSYFTEWQEDYGRSQQVMLGGRTYVTYRPRVSVAIPGTFVSSDTEWQVRDVTVFRTEVLDALKAITGQNFGFDEAAWRRWHEEQDK